MRKSPLLLWSGANLLLAVGILLMMALGHNPPSLPMALTQQQIAALDPAALGLIKALAVLLNGCIAALCMLVMVIVRQAPRLGRTLAPSLVLVQACGFASDAFLSHRNLVANLISTAVLGGGLYLLRKDPDNVMA